MNSILTYLVIFLLSYNSSVDKNSDVKFLKGFFKDLVKKDYNGEAILKKYSPQVFDGNAVGENALLRKQYALDRLNELRKVLNTNELSKLKFTHVDDYQKNKQRYVFNPNDDLYIIEDHDKVVARILMKGKTIKSLGTMKKGGSYVFLLL